MFIFGRIFCGKPVSAFPENALEVTERDRMIAFMAELWDFLRARKKYWLLPIVLMMVAFGGLLLLAQGSAVAPFIYTLF
jgi:hypothetical protein